MLQRVLCRQRAGTGLRAAASRTAPVALRGGALRGRVRQTVAQSGNAQNRLLNVGAKPFIKCHDI